MGFKERLKEARLKKKMTQEQVAREIGVAKSTFTGYEKGNSEPNMLVISKIMNTLDIDANFLWQDEMDFPVTVSYKEMEHIKKCRKLDSYGKEIVETVLEKEMLRTEQLQAQQERINALETEQQETSEKIQSKRMYIYMRRIACAGEGFYFDDIPTETIEAPYMEGADFIIGVNGDSMEPDYFDGDKVYVKKTEHISHGDVGIFTIGNECFLKEYGEEGLISHNRDYGDIPGTEDVRLIGKVIGKVEKD